MFTGIIRAVGNITALESRGGDVRLTVSAADLPFARIQPGDSIAVSGICLTAVELTTNSFVADVSRETLECTVLSGWATGTQGNLELALTPETHLGGHFVSGHVDGLGEIISCEEDARSIRISVRAPEDLARYIARKGSITMDGISLTVNAVKGCEFELNIVPHTAEKTTIGEYKPGRKVNLEVDVIARYLERLLMEGSANTTNPTGLTKTLLAEHGFIK
jgi:riboflavin synthase